MSEQSLTTRRTEDLLRLRNCGRATNVSPLCLPIAERFEVVAAEVKYQRHVKITHSACRQYDVREPDKVKTAVV